MRNIHVLPTTEATNLAVINGKLELLLPPEDKETWSNGNGKYIYITSNEDIKEGDCIMATDSSGLAKITDFKRGYIKIIIQNNVDGSIMYHQLSDWKKIILTTDQELIADGIEQLSEDKLLKIVEFLNFGKNIESFDEL